MIEIVEDQVYQNSRHRDIHPYGKCPFGDSLMLIVLLLYSEPER